MRRGRVLLQFCSVRRRSTLRIRALATPTAIISTRAASSITSTLAVAPTFAPSVTALATASIALALAALPDTAASTFAACAAAAAATLTATSSTAAAVTTLALEAAVAAAAVRASAASCRDWIRPIRTASVERGFGRAVVCSTLRGPLWQAVLALPQRTKPPKETGWQRPQALAPIQHGTSDCGGRASQRRHGGKWSHQEALCGGQCYG